MTRFYNSGLYSEPFFTKHKKVNLALFDNEYLHDEIDYDVSNSKYTLEAFNQRMLKISFS